MIRSVIMAALALVCVASTAEARQRAQSAHCVETGSVMAPVCMGAPVGRADRGEATVRAMGGLGAARERHAVADWRSGIRQKPARRERAVRTETASYGVPTPSVGYTAARAVSGIVAPLAAKVAEIQGACGSKVVSAVRHTNIAGTRRLSLHASGQAVDMAGNPGCVYAHLQGYAGGYSTDYARMAHVHISWGGPEHGIRFVHGGGGHHHRYAHRHHNRYASRNRSHYASRGHRRYASAR